MFRTSARHILSASRPTTNVTQALVSRRFISTAPPHKRSRSWKNSFLRWGLAGGLIYYYNTSSVFADEPSFTVHAPPELHVEAEQEILPTIDQISAERQASKKAAPAPAQTPVAEEVAASPEAAVAGSPEELEEEAGQQGAFNEETGEINWDCPCLGGMAHGPCGEQFREAFSCFVFSKEEPKGVDCIEKFKGMQDCFRQHPEIYGSELEEDETAELIGEGGAGDVPAGAEAGVGAAVAPEVPTKEAAPSTTEAPAASTPAAKEASQ